MGTKHNKKSHKSQKQDENPVAGRNKNIAG